MSVADPLILVISGDIYRAIVRHGYDGIDQRAFYPLIRVRIGGPATRGWIHIPGQAARDQVTEIAATAVRPDNPPESPHTVTAAR